MYIYFGYNSVTSKSQINKETNLKGIVYGECHTARLLIWSFELSYVKTQYYPDSRCTIVLYPDPWSLLQNDFGGYP